MENIGLIVLAFGIGSPIAVFAGLLHAVNHSLVKALLFCTSGNILMKYRSRSLDDIKGMLRVIPGTSLLLFIGTIALVGSPPFNIFISKFMIIASGLGAGYIWIVCLCLFLLMVIFAAFFRMITTTVFGKKPEEVVDGEFSWHTLLPPALLVGLILILGIYLPPQLSILINDASEIVLMKSITLTAANANKMIGGSGLSDAQIYFSAILNSLH